MIRYRSVLAVCLLAVLASGAALADAGSDGQAGQAGSAGARGQNGKIGGIEEWYARYPLCSLAPLIAAAHDAAKLQEYLAAGCSVGQVAAHTNASMLTYALTRQEPELLGPIASDPKARREIDPYTPVPDVDVLENLPASLNPIELTLYFRLINRNAAADFPREPFSKLYVDENQLAMLQLLLSAAADGDKLKAATAQALQRLKDSDYKSFPEVAQAVRMIEARVAELAR